MKNPNPLMLLRIAQADAYCMATEYLRPDHQGLIVEARKFTSYLRHPTHALRPGMYTDDTQMSIAVAEQLLSGERSTALSFANHFMTAFARDPRDGYSRGFQTILESSTTGQDLIDRLVPTSTRNGAAMRSVPLGVIPHVNEMLDVAAIQAAVTHDTREGIVSSQAIAFLSNWALYTDEPFRTACDAMVVRWPDFAEAFMFPWKGYVADRRQRGGHDVGINTVWAVCTLLKEQTTLLGILDRIIEWGGDTDSVAAIAWGIASARMREPVPDFLEVGLEPEGRFGTQYLRDLGVRLMGRKHGR